MSLPFLIRNLPEDKKNEILLYKKNLLLKEELEFYKSIFKTHGNSAVFNLRIKTINNKKLWVDKVRDRSDYYFILSLDQDDETREWLEPVKCER